MFSDLSVTIGGVERHLRFNNYAHVELSKALFENGHFVSSPDELIDRLSEMAKENIMLFAKALVYAGIIGHDYEIGFKASVTQQEVGKLVADMKDVELENVWNTFLSAMGIDLAKIIAQRPTDEEIEETLEKKS